MHKAVMNKVESDRCEAVLRDVLHSVMTDVSAEDIERLEDMKRMYKRTVPFSKRLYVASFLLKYMMEHPVSGGRGVNFSGVAKSAIGAKDGAEDCRTVITEPRRAEKAHGKTGKTETVRRTQEVQAKSGGGVSPVSAGQDAPIKVITTVVGKPHTDGTHEKERQVSPNKEARPKVQIPEADAATIFIGIGRGRRVFPRDLVGLLVNAAHIERDRIGDIKVLSNYSFVQMYKEDAQKAITALTGYEYRGKTLAVSYSREGGGEAEKDADTASTAADTASTAANSEASTDGADNAATAAGGEA